MHDSVAIKTKPIKDNFNAQTTPKGVVKRLDNDIQLATLHSFFLSFVLYRDSLFLVY